MIFSFVYIPGFEMTKKIFWSIVSSFKKLQVFCITLQGETFTRRKFCFFMLSGHLGKGLFSWEFRGGFLDSVRHVSQIQNHVALSNQLKAYEVAV